MSENWCGFRHVRAYAQCSARIVASEESAPSYTAGTHQPFLHPLPPSLSAGFSLGHNYTPATIIRFLVERIKGRWGERGEGGWLLAFHAYTQANDDEASAPGVHNILKFPLSLSALWRGINARVQQSVYICAGAKSNASITFGAGRGQNAGFDEWSSERSYKACCPLPIYMLLLQLSTIYIYTRSLALFYPSASTVNFQEKRARGLLEKCVKSTLTLSLSFSCRGGRKAQSIGRGEAEAHTHTHAQWYKRGAREGVYIYHECIAADSAVIHYVSWRDEGVV